MYLGKKQVGGVERYCSVITFFGKHVLRQHDGKTVAVMSHWVLQKKREKIKNELNSRTSGEEICVDAHIS